jgi:hypothetical protein
VNLAETNDLLTFIATFDRRRFDDATVVAWQLIVADVPYADCRRAVVEHFTNSTDYLMPVHVVRGATEVDRNRRRELREAREREEQLAIESDPSRRDRSDEVTAIITDLRDRLPVGDPDKLRRAEWLEADKRRARELAAEPNPDFVAVPPPGGHPIPEES